MKKAFVLILCLILALSSFAGCGSTQASPATQAPAANEMPAAGKEPETQAPSEAPVDETVYTMIVSSPKNDKAEAPFIEWLNMLSEESNGRLQFDIYTSNALYQQSEVISAMNAGMCDVCDLSLSEDSSTFALNSNIISLPFMGMGFENDWIYSSLLDEYPELLAEYDNAGVMLLDYSYNPPFNLHFSTDAPVTVPSDLNGLKIVTTSDILSAFISNQGGAPVSQPITEWYNSLDKGVATGVVAHANNIFNFGIIELLKQDVIFGEGAGITTNLNAYMWSKSSWDKLPGDLQDMILSHVDDLHAATNASQQAQIADSDAACVDHGNMVTVLSEDQIAVWRSAAESVINTKIAEIESETGAPFGEMYNRALDLKAE